MINREENLIGRSLTAMSWSYSGVAISVLLQVATSILFARILGAHVTGVFVFGLLVFPPFRFICEFGLGSALIQKPVLDSDDVEAALARSMVLAVMMAAAWLGSIRVLAALMHHEQYVCALSCFALVLLLLPIQTISTAVLTKHLDQKYLQASSLLSYAGGYLGVGAYGALHDWGAWSLVLGFLVQNLIATTMLAAHTPVRLTFTFDGDARFLWRFGSRVTAINISNWLTSSLDNLAVAWFFGTTTLGIYSIAYGLVRTPADRVVSTLQNVLFPASVLARGDRERLTKGCIAALDAVFTVTAPAFCAIAALANTIVDALYGSSWYPATWVLPSFALSMILHCLTVIVSAMLWGSGGVNRDLRLQWCSAGILLIAVVVAAQVSFVAVAWAILPVTALRAVWGIRALTKALSIEIPRLLRGFRGGLVLTALTGPSLVAIDVIMRRDFISAPFRLGWEIAAGGMLWCGGVVLLHARMMTPELQAGLQSLRIALRRGKSHA